MKIFNERIYKDKKGCMWLEINFCEHFKLGRIGDKENCWLIPEAEAYFESEQHDMDAFESDWNAWCN